LARRPKAHFATTHVPSHAKIATKIPDGIVVLLDPDPVVDTKSGPQTAVAATAIHIDVIASDAHASTDI
jgi:hypothetical protein